MKFLSGLHNHSDFSDGKNTMEEMVLAALDLGFVSFGISDHAPSPYEMSFCLSPDRVAEYRGEMERLRGLYGDRVELYLGIEKDAFSDFDTTGLDYFVGSAHYVLDDDGGCHCVDHKPEMIEEAICKVGHGDPKRFIQRYFDTLCTMVEERRPDIVGHMDIFVKPNRDGRFFDEEAPWFRDLCNQAAERLAATGSVIEVNTALLSKGGRDRPYPAPFILERLARLGARVTISSDAHRAVNVDYWFDGAIELLRRAGFPAVSLFQGGRFREIAL